MTRLSLHRLDDRTTPAYGLDPTFGTGGTALIAAADPGAAFAVTAAAPLADGSLLVAGSYQTSADAPVRLGLMKLRPDGTPDPAFNAGKPAAVGPFSVADPTSVRMAVQADGKIVLAATTQSAGGGADILVARANADGTLDGQFGVSGGRVLAFDLGGNNADTAADLQVQADGRIAVLGTASTAADAVTFAGGRDVVLTVLTAGGAVDPSFAGGGTARLNFGSASDTTDLAAGLAVQADGRLVVAATGGDTGGVVVARLRADGTPDATFGSNGAVRLDPDTRPGKAVAAVDVAVDATGRVVVLGDDYQAGATGVPGFAVPSEFIVTRLTAAGAVDTAFGTNGAATVGFVRTDGTPVTENTPAQLAVLADGSVVVAGSARTAEVQSGDIFAANDFAVARLTSAGTPDTAFAPDGRLLVRFDPADGGTNDVATAAAVSADGRVVLVGNSAQLLGTGAASVAAARVAAATVPPTVPPAVPPTSPPPTVPPTNLPPGGGTGTGNPVKLPWIQPPNGGAVFSGYPAELVRQAVADVNGDGVADYVFVTGAMDARLRVVDGATGANLTADFRPYEAAFRGGLNVAAGDIDGDGKAEVVVSPDRGGSARVQAFRWANGQLTQTANFFGIMDPDFRGGAAVAVGDFNGDGRADLAVGAGVGGGPRVAVYNGTALGGGAAARLAGDFFALPDLAFRGGVSLAAADFDGDGRADLAVGGGPGGRPQLRVLKGMAVAAGDPAAGVLSDFLVRGGRAGTNGVSVSVQAKADGKFDLVATDAVGSRQYAGDQLQPGAEAPATDLLAGPRRWGLGR